MVNTVRVQRSITTNIPASLLQGELAYSETGSPDGLGRLFIGVAGPAIVEIGGERLAAIIDALTITGALTGDVTTIGNAATIPADSIAYAQIQELIGNNVILGNIAGAGNNAAELTATQVTAMLNVFTSGLKGLVPNSGGGTTNYLRADGTFAPPPGGSGMTYIGGYNASTNTPDLDSSPSGGAQGDTYTITVAGTFFTTPLEVGDTIIAEIDNPTVEADWTMIQANLDAASIKTLYESNADTNELSDAEQVLLDNLTGSNTGDQTITLTGNVTGSGTGSFATTIAAGVVTLAMMANVNTNSLIGRFTAASGVPEEITSASLTEEVTPVAGDFIIGFR
jgi:hypothetical protein